MKKRNKTSSSKINIIQTPTQSNAKTQNRDFGLENLSSRQGSEALHNHGAYFYNPPKVSQTHGRKQNLLATGRMYDNNSLQNKNQ